MIETRPANLLPHPGNGGDHFSLVQAVLHGLRYVKYGVAGAIGSMAVAHTVGQVLDMDVTHTGDIVSGLCGAVVMVVVAKGVRLL